MSTIREIQKFPREFTRTQVEEWFTTSDNFRRDWSLWKSNAPVGWHESLMRSFQILEKVKELLRKNTPQDVILEIIEECERDLGIPKETKKHNATIDSEFAPGTPLGDAYDRIIEKQNREEGT